MSRRRRTCLSVTIARALRLSRTRCGMCPRNSWRPGSWGAELGIKVHALREPGKVEPDHRLRRFRVPPCCARSCHPWPGRSSQAGAHRPRTRRHRGGVDSCRVPPSRSDKLSTRNVIQFLDGILAVALTRPDLLGRNVTACAPGDITYIPTWQGWVYLATVLDCHTKAVIGWAMDDNYQTPLIEKAIRMAARNYRIRRGAIFHSDRGSNYTSAQFAGTLRALGIRQSVGRTGICYDNAMAESFFGALKNERVHRVVYPTRKVAMADIAAYIELRYNHQRLHSGLDYKSPNETYNEYLTRQQAA